MFRSRAVAYVKPSSSCRSVLILGIGNHFLTIHLFNLLKSLTTLMVLSFFGTIKVGEAHSESACHCNTLKLHSHWISFLVTSKCFLGTGNVWSWYGCALLALGGRPARNPSPLVFYQEAPQSLVGAPVTMIVLGSLWCVQLFLTISLRFAFS